MCSAWGLLVSGRRFQGPMIFPMAELFRPPLVVAVQPWCVAGVRLMGWDLDFLREGFDVFSSCVVVLPLAPPR